MSNIWTDEFHLNRAPSPQHLTIWLHLALFIVDSVGRGYCLRAPDTVSSVCPHLCPKCLTLCFWPFAPIVQHFLIGGTLKTRLSQLQRNVTLLSKITDVSLDFWGRFLPFSLQCLEKVFPDRHAAEHRAYTLNSIHDGLQQTVGRLQSIYFHW